MCLYYLSYMIQIAILSYLLLVIATTMKEEVTSALFILVNNYNMNSYTGNMQGCASIFYNSIIYKMPMHRKKVRIKICWIYALWFILSSLKILKILIGLITPWDPGINPWNTSLGKRKHLGTICLMISTSLKKSK